MRVSVTCRRIGVAVSAAFVAAACSSDPQPAPAPESTTAASSSAPASTGLAAAPVAVPPALADAPFDEPREALIPAGWSLSVWARVPEARLARWTPDGALLVSVPESGRIVKLEPGGEPPRESTFLEGLDQPHGMAFSGATLYIAESDQIDAYDYVDGAAINRRTVAAGLPDAKSPDLRGAYAHALKSVVVGPDGAVYFSIGSTGNISAEDRDATPPRATIMRVPAGGGPAEPFATGVRNGTGLAVAPDGAVWTAVNGRDNVLNPATGRVDPEYVADHPPEQLPKLTPGRELGWPYCNIDQGASGGTGDLGFIRDVQTNADGSKMDCAALSPVEQSFGAHSAPLGLSFVDGSLPAPYTQGALVGIHGSWNAQPPRAPEVSFYPYSGGDLGDQQTLVGGFQSGDGSRWGRPVDAVAGPDGAVYITDDDAGAVYRLAPPR
ncbi:gluconolaconase [Mycobacterium sp. 852013-51886_SCH5428379]|uniref:PQQ-dependent sugar dehydrogenase n=1 Tax=Mycobacterium sp. 852013-51886_SCH5428379 TaxID=1834111 RepID=UPI000800CBFA|nr:gluconolaconase [Mycobacterium sp. 852013-51886_SCH5428379]OBB57630.1 gluconolaconase [Mycobacterium sp. 852013-51886_SCH5428379]